MLLRLWGFQVEVAADGPEGLRKALDWRPQVALPDIGLPGMDGYELARRLREAIDARNLHPDALLTAYLVRAEDVRVEEASPVPQALAA
jgi:two-component system, sensor histidine kinase